ncbi:MAG: DUF309 domain-containing protein [Candidatus Calescibacterium sp.]|nr:DUF309 domain-containing protein [Candidatus Calescibacterium sp.]MDW8132393.1 DUF309 domain-containing protein [Candidatus Calescibacterium sp.]
MNDLSVSFRSGLSLFKKYRFWEAHEKWEELWNKMKLDNRLHHKSDIIKGIIQISAAFHKLYNQKNIYGFKKIILNSKKYFQNYPQIVKYLNSFYYDIDVMKYQRVFEDLIESMETDIF